MEILQPLNSYQKMMVSYKATKQRLTYHILCYAVLEIFITSQVHSKLQFKLFHTTAGLYIHHQYVTDGKTPTLFIINGTAQLRCFKYSAGAAGGGDTATVTCHDLGTDKTLRYSGFGAAAINTKRTAPDLLPIIDRSTALLLAAHNEPAQALTQLQQNQRKSGLRTSLRAASASDTTESPSPYTQLAQMNLQMQK